MTRLSVALAVLSGLSTPTRRWVSGVLKGGMLLRPISPRRHAGLRKEQGEEPRLADPVAAVRDQVALALQGHAQAQPEEHQARDRQQVGRQEERRNGLQAPDLLAPLEQRGARSPR